MSQAPKRVHMFVYNNCSKDARVLKEAASLAKAGYEVKIVAVLDKYTVPFEKRDGFEIHRVDRESLHVKAIQFIQGFFRSLQFVLLLPFRIITWVALRAIWVIRWLNPTFGIVKSEHFQSEDSGRALIARIIRNPHRYSLREYLAAFNLGQTLFARGFAMTLGVIGFPFFFIGRAMFLAFNSIQRNVTKFVRKSLMPYHRTSVFKDYYIKSAQFCEDYPADVLHFHDLHTLPIIDHLKSKGAMKFVYDSHELYTEIHTLQGAQKKKYIQIETKKIKEVDRVITVNPSIARELVERYRIPNPTIVMNCPPAMEHVPVGSTLLSASAGLKSGELIILYQGGYSTGRGLEELILAMQWVDRGTLVMMGWGLIEDELQDLVRKHKLDKKVKFIPPADQDKVLDFTCGADIGMIPYRAIGLNNYYTSPNKLFEYIQAHVVVAGSNFPELKRVIETYDIGDFFDPEDPKSIADCINRLTSNPEHLKQMKSNILKAAEHFHWGTQEMKLLEVYASLN